MPRMKVSATRGAGAAMALVLAACNPSPYREVSLNLELEQTAKKAEAPARQPQAFRISVASMESARDTFGDYSHLFEEVGRRLGVEVDFVQRRTYGEVNDLLVEGGVDAALICTGGYADIARRAPGSVEVLAVPVVKGMNTYQSLIVVPTASPAQTLLDLGGKRFAFTDELSLTGRGYVLHVLASMGKDPERFFGSTIYTYGHDRSVTAVARGLVDGAAIHSIIFDHQLTHDPSLAERVRIIHRSPPFGMTPVVASTRLSVAQRSRLREILLRLDQDPQGAAALLAVHIDRFSPAPPGLFDSSLKLLER